VLAAWLHTLDPDIVHIGRFSLKWYGLSYVLSALFGYWLYRRLAERKYTDIAPARVADFITWIGILGVIAGGRIGWILFYGLKQNHENDPWYWWLRVWEGGMSSHGGILGIVIVTYVISRRWKVSWTSIGDSLCVVAPVGLFLVRCANFINGELYGHETNAAWAVKFPQEIHERRFEDVAEKVFHAVEPHQALLERYGRGGEVDWADRIIAASRHEPVIQQAIEPVLTPRHPSQLYEALLEGALLFAILWPLRTRCRMPRGALTGLFFILYALARIAGEVYRVPDPAWSVGKFSAGQFLSLFMFGIGGAFLVWSRKTRQYEVADQKETPPIAPSEGR
jgi:phosphatidylglycerol---prolipoprotein diacylglyceryl transferase